MKSHNKLPPELHIVRGTKGENAGVLIPENLRQRIPIAEWQDNLDAWDEKVFIKETADFLYETYGLGSAQDRHLLTMLAKYITLYIRCWKSVETEPVIAEFNNGKTMGANPHITVAKDTMNKIVSLCNELGLTPRGRLSTKMPEKNEFDDLLAGVKKSK